MKRITASWLMKGDVFVPVEPREGGAWLEVMSHPKVVDGKAYFQCGVHGSPAHGQWRMVMADGRLVEINEVAQ